MTYTPPEGVSIGTFTADTLPASFNAPAGAVVSYKIYGTSEGAGVETESGEPAGYKIPILLESGITENLFDVSKIQEGTSVNGGTVSVEGNEINITTSSQSNNTPDAKPSTLNDLTNGLLEVGKNYKFSLTSSSLNYIYLYGANIAWNNATSLTITQQILDSQIRWYATSTNSSATIKDVMIYDADEIVDHYIPHRYASNYDLMIGSTKLGAEEYVDYAEQKIYKMSGSTLVPTDPPVPLPAIQTYQGENTLSSMETLGEVELTGDWLAIMGSTEDESIDIGFTVDADEFIAFATVDDGPSIQVSETITMPTSADSFTLDVVSWGRERYTETVYSALSLDDLTLTPQT